MLLCPFAIFGQEINNNSSKNDDVISNFLLLSSKQLYYIAEDYYKTNSYDSAIICYNLLIKTIPPNSDYEQQKVLMNSYNRLAIIFCSKSDYRTAYDYFIRALSICEKNNLDTEKSNIYANIGVVYSSFKQYDFAKQYFLSALDLCKDSMMIINMLNNLGFNEMLLGRLDSAYYYLNKAYLISKRHNDFSLQLMLNNFATLFQKEKQYDSAFYYYHSSLYYSRLNNDIRVEAGILSDLGKFLFEIDLLDSALFYIDLSNKIASENKFLETMATNFLTLSEIEKSKKRYEKSLNHHITYTNLKDSIYNAEIFGDINQMQSMYEISKKNEQIEELVIDLKVKERTIHQQKIIRHIIIYVFLFLCCIFIYILFLHKKIRKFQKKLQLHDERNELKSKILNIIEDKSIICDPDFSINKLAELAQSNRNYVSEVINNSYNQNFRSLLNTYRIREAQQLFSKQDTSKFTIDTVANLVGYKSPKSFYDAFKRVTGITPSTYLKSIQE